MNIVWILLLFAFFGFFGKDAKKFADNIVAGMTVLVVFFIVVMAVYFLVKAILSLFGIVI